VIEPPINAEVIKFKKHLFWYNADGVLFGKSIMGEASEVADIAEFIEYFITNLKGNKICILVDFSNVSKSNREIREYVNKEFPKMVKAVAMISKTPLGRMMANLFFSLKKQPYPTKMFEEEKEALEWLKQYL
jgi:SpoIIAA-like